MLSSPLADVDDEFENDVRLLRFTVMSFNWLFAFSGLLRSLNMESSGLSEN